MRRDSRRCIYIGSGIVLVDDDGVRGEKCGEGVAGKYLNGSGIY